MPAPADTAVASLLVGVASGATTLALGSNVFRGPPRAHGGGIPIGPVVFVLATGGPPPQPYAGTDQDFCVETVQVTVRAKPDKFDDGQMLARAVRVAVHKQEPEGFISVFARESQPTYLGPDGNGCHLWTVNFECRVVRDT